MHRVNRVAPGPAPWNSVELAVSPAVCPYNFRVQRLNKTLEVRVGPRDLARLDDLVGSGFARSRAEATREAIIAIHARVLTKEERQGGHPDAPKTADGTRHAQGYPDLAA